MTNPLTRSLSKALAASALTWDNLVELVRSQSTRPERVETPLPKPVALSTGQRQALHDVADFSGDWTFPQSRRVLSADEKATYQARLIQIKRAASALAVAEAQVKNTWHNHYDTVAENDSRVTPSVRTHPKNGWYCLEDEKSGVVEGEAVKVTREVAGGGANLTEVNLRSMETQGLITHEDYLAFTRQVRVVDHDAVLKAVADRGAEFARVLVANADQLNPTVSIHVRPNT